MLMRTARNWLGIYYLVTVTLIGCYLILFAGSPLLPLEDDQATAAFQVIVPVFVGQIAVIFKWLAAANVDAIKGDDICPLPGWVVVMPPLLCFTVFFASAMSLYVSNQNDAFLDVSPKDFQTTITFSMSILSASTILLMPRIFPAS